MKIRPRIIVKTAVLFATVLLVMVVCTVNSAAISSKNKNIEYINNHFSIIYTAEWKSLPKEQRIAKLELSSEFLEELTDTELVYAVIHYPFTGDMVVHENLREGYEYVLSYSEVLKEYDHRDGKQTMLNEYYNSELCTAEEKANYMYQWIFNALLSLSIMEDTE